MKKKFAFVLMPFSKKFNDIYSFGIKGACEEIGVYCERVDEQIFSESILERVYNQINKADIIIADMSEKNPNVFYETGYAHALNKNVILLTKRAEDIPFDLQHYPHIIYSDQIIDLKQQLVRRLNYFTSSESSQQVNVFESIDIIVNGINIKDIKKLQIIGTGLSMFDKYEDFELEFAFKNTAYDIYDTEPTIQLKLPNGLLDDDFYRDKVIKLPDGKVLYKVGNIPKIFPGAWTDYRNKFSIENDKLQKCNFKTELIFSTRYGTFVYDFELELLPSHKSIF